MLSSYLKQLILAHLNSKRVVIDVVKLVEILILNVSNASLHLARLIAS